MTMRRTLNRWLKSNDSVAVRKANLNVVTLEDRLTPTVVIFQEGQPLNVDGTPVPATTYIGTADAEITAELQNAGVNFGQTDTVSVDQQDALGNRQVLLRFDNIFGSNPGQIPIGSKINSASLNLRVTSATNNESFNSFNRMLVPWGEDTVTWNSFPSVAGGVQFDGIEAVELPDGQLQNASAGNNINTNIDISPSLRSWAAGISNFGWLVHQFGENGWDFKTRSNPDLANRPKLTVDFTPPSGAGTIGFLQNSLTYAPYHATVSEGNSGSKAVTFTVVRSAGDTGVAKIDYALDTDTGTATLGGDYTFTGGTLTFADGERVKSFTVTVNGDTTIEGPETVRLRLSNPVGATLDAASSLNILRIGDNDLLINEVVNVNSSGSDIGYEYVELLGTNGASLGGLGGKDIYLVAINGDTSENNASATTSGDLTNINNIGKVDYTFNLGKNVNNGNVPFNVGSGGLLTVRSSDSKFFYYQTATAPAGNTDVIDPVLDVVLDPTFSASEGAFDNGSITFALIMSPTAIPLGFDFDSNNDGTIDNFPAGAVLLDAISTSDVHRPSSDRGVGEGWAGTRVIQAIGYSDALTRFNSITTNDLAPTRIFSWYAGDLRSDKFVYVDPNSTAEFGRASNNITAGAQITPGKLNIPRAFTFDANTYSVNETAGTVTITVNRLGDDTVAASINYATVDGTAVAGSDFVATSGKLDFPIGVTTKTFTVPLINDSDAEGFQSFQITLSSPLPSQFVISSGSTRVTIVDDDSIVKDFQEELDGYFGTRDTTLVSTGGLSKDNLSSDITINVDQDDNTPAGPTQGLLRFDNVFGTGLNQVPVGSRIYSAQLTFNVTDGADANTRIRFFRILQNWDAGKASWFDPLGTGSATPTVTNGFTPDGVEAAAVADFEINPASRIGSVTVDIPADTLQAWANGAGFNGWLMASQSTNGWEVDSADAFLINARPKLSLIYTEPTGAGGFRFEQPTYTVNEGQTTATFTIQRTGGNTGDANITYNLQGVTATAGTGGDFTATSGTFTFTDGGPISQTFTVSLLEDNASERNETFNLVLSNPTGGATLLNATASVAIRDNDVPTVYLNEVLINPPGTDAPFEYLELAGTASTGLGNVYLVGIEGDNNVFAGHFDTVFELSALNNGTTGFTVVKGDDGGFAIPAGTTVVTSPLLGSTNNNAFRTLQNDTNAYVVIYSPNATISSDVFDYDWDNNGTLELPAGAFILDGIGISDNTVGDVNYSTATLDGLTATEDAVTRIAGNTNLNDASAWYFGDLVNLTGNSSRYYVQQPSTDSSANTPAGAVLTPGAANYAVNSVPVITSNGAGATATVSVASGTTAVTTVTFTDADIGQPFAFTLSGPDAGKFSINQSTGKLAFAAAPDVNTPADANSDNVYEVTVTLTDGTATDVQAISVKVLPVVTGFTVNGGNAQRSRITTLTLSYNSPVVAADFTGLGAITLTRTGVASPATGTIGDIVQTGPAADNHITVTQGSATSLILTFDNLGAFNTESTGVENGSLSDGYWKLQVGPFASTTGDLALRRLFGDSTTSLNGQVSGDDFLDFGNFFNSNDSRYDYNNDGTISGADALIFGNRFGRSL